MLRNAAARAGLIALLVSVVAGTAAPAGAQAPEPLVPVNADKVDGFDASLAPGAGLLLPLDGQAHFPWSTIPGCPVGQLLKFQGTGWACADDAGGTAYAAGSGLTLAGSTFAANFTAAGGDNGTAVTVARGDHLHDGRYYTQAQLNAAGTINTAANPVDWTRLKSVPAGLADGVDNDTTYAAGAGLALTGTTFSANTSALQSRVTGSCPAAAAISAVNQDGTVTCQSTAGTVYTGAAPITVTGSVIGLSSTGCSAGYVWKWNGAAWACAADAGTTYTAGTGLTLEGTTFAANLTASGGDDGTAATVARGDHLHDARYYTQSQLNVAGTINTGSNPVDWSKLKSVPAGLADGVDNDTTYTAGTGLALTGTTFSLADGGVGTAKLADGAVTASKLSFDPATQAELDAVTGNLSSAGTINTASNPVDWTKLKGVPAGFADGTDANTIYAAGTGLALTGTTFSADAGYLQRRVSGTCTGGNAVSAVNADGTVACAGGTGWGLAGNAGTTPGTNFIGTTDNQALELKVNGSRAFRLEPNGTSPGVIGGYSGNTITSGVVGGTIAGGGEVSYTNRVTDDYGTIGGGMNNVAGDGAGTTADRNFATVAGGLFNTAGGTRSAVGGGAENNASGAFSVAPGGLTNTAAGDYSLAAGRRAKANNAGSFVWADSTDADFGSTASNQFLIRASGGVGIGTNNPGGAQLRVAGLIRAGSEAGTSEGPAVTSAGSSYAGTLVRRIQSVGADAGAVVAKTDNLRLERDGSAGGWRIFAQGLFRLVACLGMKSDGTSVNRYFSLADGTYPLYSDSDAVVHMHCTFGDPVFNGHATTVTLSRLAGDFHWVGILQSTVNQ